LVEINSGGILTMKGNVAISGNTTTSVGGGVYVGYNGTFTMEGGEISGNNTASSGGGVYVSSGIFTMKDGEISGNTATDGGGGVLVSSGGTFTMEDGKINDNTTAGKAGGVYNGGTFEMSGGEISGNTANHGGGGVYVVGTFTKKGGIIYGDTDTTHAAGNTENTASNGIGHAVYLYHPINQSYGKMRNSTAGTGVNLYANYASSTWSYIDPAVGGVGDTTENWENGM
jgi:predicted outer membrane repeat protein